MSVEAMSPQAADTSSESVLSISDLKISFSTEDGVVEAVKGIGFDVAPGEIVAIVGESGSGKSVTSMSVPGLLTEDRPHPGRAQIGGGRADRIGEELLRASAASDIAMIFQEPMTALNPVYTIGWQVTRRSCCHKRLSAPRPPARGPWSC